MPDVLQQPKVRSDPTQSDHNDPRHYKKQCYGCDVDTEQINLAESHVNAPASKYSACWESASDTTRMLSRICMTSDAPGASAGRAVSARSRAAKHLIDAALLPCVNASSASITSEVNPNRRALLRNWVISTPTDSAAINCASCNGAVSSGMTDKRFTTMPFHSFAVGGLGCVAMRRRSRRVSASSRRERVAGASGGTRRKERAAAPTPTRMANALL